jgi:hypothetical protein
MAAHAHDSITPVTPAWSAWRAEAGSIRLSQRAINGLIMAGEHSGVPLALPGAAFTPEQPR